MATLAAAAVEQDIAEEQPLRGGERVSFIIEIVKGRPRARQVVRE